MPDYPREKLDVIIAVEADDRETRLALSGRSTTIPVTIIVVPPGGPRTKPKALNAALPFARGTFTVVFDAEDRPEPDQLRAALSAFRNGDDRLACVQARLCIDNTADSLLTRLFTAEYAGQFDVFLKGLAALGLPIPLGGSSNHFRTALLRKAGAWDAYNVTEDADLGLRLARLGYRTDVIASTTMEEAPARPGAWLRQRTRWFKGWLQTWVVHMREPRRLWREMGPSGFVALQILVGGTVLAALVHPFFLIGFMALVMDDGLAAPGISLLLYGGSVLAGYSGSVLLGWMGLSRRGLTRHAWVLLAMPLHWLLLSAAAWRALAQLVTKPYVWEKTEHGLARTSRSAQRTALALLELERQLTALHSAGKLPVLATARHASPLRASRVA